MKYAIALLVTAACISLPGCQEKVAEASYDSNEIEAYLNEHPELKNAESGGFSDS
ncbi:hypothetical protein SAMN06265222_12074 [Neorhodopirellula lusitana]|uniref:Secreted protein n=1 Tax=Neorhodopirellula lusitana TaxID=445327 RepID=A0ABY1QNZ5_9BACT|nr:hypothetical protein SAMN06265222_12074 [Neorhodopirellula lusitana]